MTETNAAGARRRTARMKLIPGAAAAAVAIAVLGFAIPALQAPTVSASSLPVAYGFDGNSGWHHGEIRPHAIYFGTGGSLFARRIAWADWKQSSASGHGTRWADNCIPDCARGTYVRSPASLTLWRVRVHGGHRYFSRLTMRWTRNGTRHKYIVRWSTFATGSQPFWH